MSARLYVNLHGVGAPHAGVDDEERRYWLSPDTLREVIGLVAAQAPHVGVTFDDGNASDCQHALPLLKRAGLSAHFFIPTERIGAPLYLNADDIRTLHKEGMPIGSHGVAHVAWPTLSDAALGREIDQSFATLSDIVGAPVRSVGVPFGAYDSRVLRLLRRKGATRVFTSDGGPCLPQGWLIPRNSIRADMPMGAIADMLAAPAGAGRFYLRAARRVGRRMLSARPA